MSSFAEDVIEKGTSKTEINDDTNANSSSDVSIHFGQVHERPSWKQRFWQTIRAELAVAETRGVARVPPEERQPPSAGRYIQMISLWTSANLTANHVTLGFLGPSVYKLSLLDSALCAFFGVVVGAACTGYISTFGPQSGNRTMIIARYSMGWWPSRICAVLNVVIMLGYGMIDTVVGGQILNAVSGAKVSVTVGVVVVAILSWSITMIGMPVIHTYEKYGWISQACVLLVLAGCAGPHFNTSLQSTGSTATIAGNRLSMFALCLSAPSSWAPAGADFYVYFAEKTSKPMTFFLTWAGELLGYMFALLLGIGIASGISTQPSWAIADEKNPGSLLVAAYEPLGAFGHFCAIILMLGIIGNNVPGTYACGLGLQCLGSWFLKVPRMAWTTLSVVVYTICGAVGQNHLYDIFENFLSLMGYWITIWVVITLQEQLLFRRKIGFVWEDWNNRKRLPVGLAALAAFLVGWAGAVICMDQVYFVGPISRLIGDDGSDIGLFVGSSWAALVFPPLRWLEKRYIGR